MEMEIKPVPIKEVLEFINSFTTSIKSLSELPAKVAVRLVSTFDSIIARIYKDEANKQKKEAKKEVKKNKMQK